MMRTFVVEHCWSQICLFAAAFVPTVKAMLLAHQIYTGGCYWFGYPVIGLECQQLLFLNYRLSLKMDKQEESFDGSFSDNIRSAAYKNQFSTKKHKMVINVAETQYAVVKHVAKKNRWYMQTDPIMNLNFDLCWTDNHVKPELFARMQTHQKINHFPGMAILSRKNNLGMGLMQFRKQFPGDYEFFPITWSLPNEYSDLLAYHECRQQGKAQTFIVKPEASCQGRGIYMTRNIEKLKNERCVVQRYLHKPYLIEGLKFDMRIYVLISGIDPLRIFVYEEGLARFATEEYRAPRSENLENKFMHLTNYAINKDSPKFIFNESVENMDVGHKRSLTSVFKHIASQGQDVQLLKQNIYDIIIKTIITGYPTLSASVSSVHPENFANDMCFEVLGFDVMLDHKLTPYLLQINYTPSFTADTPLDCHIKKSLISDTLNLVNATEKWKKETKLRRDKEIQERMMSGKRKKYGAEERVGLGMEEARRRDEHERSNMGRYTKIFMLSQAQFNEYKKYYDFATELFNLSSRLDNPSLACRLGKEGPAYHSYFEPKPREKPKKHDKENLKNNRTINQSKENQQLTRSGQNHMALANSSLNKRVSSAVSRQDRRERKVVYDRVSSKKSLKNQEYGRNNQELEADLTQNASIFTNKNIQQLILKQRQSELPGELHDSSFENDFN